MSCALFACRKKVVSLEMDSRNTFEYAFAELRLGSHAFKCVVEAAQNCGEFRQPFRTIRSKPSLTRVEEKRKNQRAEGGRNKKTASKILHRTA